jgi:hypothetical protein
MLRDLGGPDEVLRKNAELLATLLLIRHATSVCGAPSRPRVKRDPTLRAQ